MREECAWDANEDIRKLVASHETGDASPS
jgi:hypothetical protein